ncbi:hypothetical protein [Variovorax sp. RA8]|uniref:hypothetical protein n=1 Tax=Variovorax sp. (strain JCM 16519 / RA8) TaxID=662548 RepID=UPI0013198A00|nr:hypothetical protein [Variovorax sp. RA8]VTU44970.1 hypothetical protein RA8P2_00406 [Variovorax sp. RA8]
MSNLEEDGTRSQGNEGSLDDLWGAEGGSEGVEAPELHDRVDPGFDNSEARDTLSESLEDPVDAIPRDPEGDAEPAPKKNSNLPFYGAVGAVVLVAAGIVGYKTGLIGSSSRKAIEPTIASAMDSAPAIQANKPNGMLDSTGPSKASSPDLFGESGSKTAPALDAEADLLADKGPAPAAAPAAPAEPAPPAALELAQPVQKAPEVAPAVVAQAPVPAPAPAAPPAAPPSEVQKAVPATTAPIEVAKAPPKAEAPSTAAVAKAERPKPSKRVTVAVAPKMATPAKAAASRVVEAKPARVIRLADARKPSKVSGKGRRAPETDSTPESREVLAGWKLRGTWPNHGPSQLVWIADEQGRLTTVSVGAMVAGARVLSIGKRGEVVQTTAGQIIP